MNLLLDPSLVLYLPLYELDGSPIMSREAYGRPGTVTGAIWTPRGESFDGIDDRVTVADASAGALYPAEFTWEFWANPADFSAIRALLGSVNASPYRPWECHLSLTTGRIFFALRQSDDGQPSLTVTDITPAADTWNHIVVTGDGTTLKGYLNGQQSIDTASYDGTLSSVSRQPNMLGVTRGARWMLGTVGEVRLYNRALTLSEIQNNRLVTKWRYR